MAIEKSEKHATFAFIKQVLLRLDRKNSQYALTTEEKSCQRDVDHSYLSESYVRQCMGELDKLSNKQIAALCVEFSELQEINEDTKLNIIKVITENCIISDIIENIRFHMKKPIKNLAILYPNELREIYKNRILDSMTDRDFYGSYCPVDVSSLFNDIALNEKQQEVYIEAIISSAFSNHLQKLIMKNYVKKLNKLKWILFLRHYLIHLRIMKSVICIVTGYCQNPKKSNCFC